MSKTTVQKRIDSTKQYVDTLMDLHSKLNVVRVDLGYKKDEETKKTEISLDEATQDFNRMLNNRRGKPSIFENQVGYIAKKEYTEDKGIHIHTCFFYDGQKIQKDSFKASQIGEYWEQITKERDGIHHNCNKDKKKYKNVGIGMVDYKDSEKRKVLDEIVIPYMCKDDQDIGALKGNKRSKAFTRGIVTKKKSTKGRPREQ